MAFQASDKRRYASLEDDNDFSSMGVDKDVVKDVIMKIRLRRERARRLLHPANEVPKASVNLAQPVAAIKTRSKLMNPLVRSSSRQQQTMMQPNTSDNKTQQLPVKPQRSFLASTKRMKQFLQGNRRGSDKQDHSEQKAIASNSNPEAAQTFRITVETLGDEFIPDDTWPEKYVPGETGDGIADDNSVANNTVASDETQLTAVPDHLRRIFSSSTLESKPVEPQLSAMEMHQRQMREVLELYLCGAFIPQSFGEDENTEGNKLGRSSKDLMGKLTDHSFATSYFDQFESAHASSGNEPKKDHHDAKDDNNKANISHCSIDSQLSVLPEHLQGIIACDAHESTEKSDFAPSPSLQMHQQTIREMFENYICGSYPVQSSGTANNINTDESNAVPNEITVNDKTVVKHFLTTRAAKFNEIIQKQTHTEVAADTKHYTNAKPAAQEQHDKDELSREISSKKSYSFKSLKYCEVTPPRNRTRQAAESEEHEKLKTDMDRIEHPPAIQRGLLNAKVSSHLEARPSSTQAVSSQDNIAREVEKEDACTDGCGFEDAIKNRRSWQDILATVSSSVQSSPIRVQDSSFLTIDSTCAVHSPRVPGEEDVSIGHKAGSEQLSPKLFLDETLTTWSKDMFSSSLFGDLEPTTLFADSTNNHDINTRPKSNNTATESLQRQSPTPQSSKDDHTETPNITLTSSVDSEPSTMVFSITSSSHMSLAPSDQGKTQRSSRIETLASPPRASLVAKRSEHPSPRARAIRAVATFLPPSLRNLGKGGTESHPQRSRSGDQPNISLTSSSDTEPCTTNSSILNSSQSIDKENVQRSSRVESLPSPARAPLKAKQSKQSPPKVKSTSDVATILPPSLRRLSKVDTKDLVEPSPTGVESIGFFSKAPDESIYSSIRRQSHEDGEASMVESLGVETFVATTPSQHSLPNSVAVYLTPADRTLPISKTHNIAGPHTNVDTRPRESVETTSCPADDETLPVSRTLSSVGSQPNAETHRRENMISSSCSADDKTLPVHRTQSIGDPPTNVETHPRNGEATSSCAADDGVIASPDAEQVLSDGTDLLPATPSQSTPKAFMNFELQPDTWLPAFTDFLKQSFTNEVVAAIPSPAKVDQGTAQNGFDSEASHLRSAECQPSDSLAHVDTRPEKEPQFPTRSSSHEVATETPNIIVTSSADSEPSTIVLSRPSSLPAPPDSVDTVRTQRLPSLVALTARHASTTSKQTECDKAKRLSPSPKVINRRVRSFLPSTFRKFGRDEIEFLPDTDTVSPAVESIGFVSKVSNQSIESCIARYKPGVDSGELDTGKVDLQCTDTFVETTASQSNYSTNVSVFLMPAEESLPSIHSISDPRTKESIVPSASSDNDSVYTHPYSRVKPSQGNSSPDSFKNMESQEAIWMPGFTGFFECNNDFKAIDSSRQNEENTAAPKDSVGCTSFEDEGPSFEDEGLSFEDEGLSFEDEGPSFEDEGPSFEDEGPSFEDEGPSFEDEGPSFEDEGPSFEDDGTSFADEGMSFADEGQSVVDEGQNVATSGMFSAIDDLWLAKLVLKRFATARNVTVDDLIEEVCDKLDELDKSMFYPSFVSDDGGTDNETTKQAVGAS